MQQRRAASLGSASAVDVARAIVEILDGRAGTVAALATVIERSGSAPQIVGARMLLRDDGDQLGTVGGGAIEAQVLDACRQSLRDGRPRRIEAHLVRDLGMCCGGSMEVFVEFLQPQPRLFVIGAGHVAQSLAPLAGAAGFRVTVLDDRDELLEHPAFAELRRESLDVDELTRVLDDLDERDYVIILTRDHARDEQALAQLLRRPHRYLGMIGSRRKVHAVLRRILHRERELGRELPDLTRVRAPIGLALGGRTPVEIAVSIVAELIADRHGGDGSAMDVSAAVRGRFDGPDDGPQTDGQTEDQTENGQG
ncbi:MAG: XdhC family protein [Deltaproteobacteria bacterium]|nr:XdhC family protein [Nannocystaceae bacterium]